VEDAENRAEWRRRTRVADPSPEGSTAWRRERVHCCLLRVTEIQDHSLCTWDALCHMATACLTNSELLLNTFQSTLNWEGLVGLNLPSLDLCRTMGHLWKILWQLLNGIWYYGGGVKFHFNHDKTGYRVTYLRKCSPFLSLPWPNVVHFFVIYLGKVVDSVHCICVAGRSNANMSWIFPEIPSGISWNFVRLNV